MALTELHKTTIVEVRAYFGFWGFACDPRVITKALAMIPTETQRKGDTWQRADGRIRQVRWSTWSIASTLESRDVNDHLRELIQRLEGKEAVVRAEWTPEFEVYWKGNYLYAGSGPGYAEFRRRRQWNST